MDGCMDGCMDGWEINRSTFRRWMRKVEMK